MNIESKNGMVVVSFDKDIDMESVSSFKNVIDTAYKDTNSKNLVFDYSKSKSITEDGVNFALGRYKRVLENNGHMYITGAKGEVDKLLNEKGIYNCIPNVKNVNKLI